MAAPRNLEAAMRAVMSLQSVGPKFLEATKTREKVQVLMEHFLKKLQVDLGSFPPVVHIAGTKGKGSTASMCEAILRQAGLKTGENWPSEGPGEGERGGD